MITFIVSLLKPIPAAQAETQLQTSKAQAVLASMTPEERIGQLFLVTFQGTDTHDQTQIYDLIANHHVGGVVLLAANDNFLPEPDTISSAHQLISALQTVEANATSAPPSASEHAAERQFVCAIIYWDFTGRGRSASRSNFKRVDSITECHGDRGNLENRNGATGGCSLGE